MRTASKPDLPAAQEFWANKGTFGTVMTGIAMALKGFSLGLTGRGEDPGKWLNDQIQQTVQDQQNRAAKSREAVGDAKDLYQFNKQSLGDDERAKLASEMALRQQMMSTIDRKVAEDTADPMKALRGAQLKKSLADQNAQTLEQFWDKTAEKHTTSGNEAYHQASRGGLHPPTRLTRAREIQKVGGELANDTGTQKDALELQKGPVGLRKDVAETAKTEAEASKLANSAAPGQNIASQDVESTAYNPLRGFQGTDANAATIGQDAYNATLLSTATKQWGARGARDIVEKLLHLAQRYGRNHPSQEAAGGAALRRRRRGERAGHHPGVAPGDEGEP